MGARMNKADPLAAAREMETKLLELLKNSQTVELIGVVGGSGPGAGQSKGETDWTMSFALEVWRIAGSMVQKREMRVIKKVSHEEWARQKNCVAPDTIVRLRGKIAEFPWGRTRMHMLLEEIIGVDRTDAEMNRVSAELKKEISFEDGVFGKLVFDRRIKWFTRRVAWRGQNADLYVHAGDEEEARRMLKTAHVLWAGEANWNARVLARAVEDLLSTKNDNWLDDNEKVVTADEFKKRMRLEAISINEGGNFEFCFADGNLFWGHVILVRGNLTEGPTGADIAG
jgi:hypothetical protein